MRNANKGICGSGPDLCLRGKNCVSACAVRVELHSLGAYRGFVYRAKSWRSYLSPHFVISNLVIADFQSRLFSPPRREAFPSPSDFLFRTLDGSTSSALTHETYPREYTHTHRLRQTHSLSMPRARGGNHGLLVNRDRTQHVPRALHTAYYT